VRPAVVALTPKGAVLGRRIAEALGGELYVRHAAAAGPVILPRGAGEGHHAKHGGGGGSKAAAVAAPSTAFGGPPPPLRGGGIFPDTAPHLRALFAEGRPIVGICAAGILIRALAPALSDKRAEPPVVAVAEDGSSAVPLLGGHRGANQLARDIAALLGGHAAVTTAGDLALGVALDAPPAGWRLANPDDAPAIMAALVGGAPARLEGQAAWLRDSLIRFDDDAAIRLIATIGRADGDRQTLVYHPQRLALGVGCERGAEAAELAAIAEATLAEGGLAAGAVACVVSLDLKADEPAVLELAGRLGVPARFFPAERLEEETPRLASPSDAVFREVGCHGVAEAAALAAAGPDGRLVVAKRKSARATCAVAVAPAPIDPAAVGRGRGRLAIVGIGPGGPGWLTPEARRLIETSDALVGYSRYLDLIAGLAPGAERLAFPLGAEAARCLTALRLAGDGRNVALISSGDPGIYAMASLVFELLDGRGPALADAARRAEIVVAPGVSALQAAAARAGAPLGHDFCAISLSDLLTPWPAIAARVEAAAAADFAIAFYNPVSRRRQWQLAEAKAILLQHRPPATPVVVARNLGREGEAVQLTNLGALDLGKLDMLSVVLVGASTTARVAAGGRDWLYTPRGYATKEAAE
jgi:cobalt-precorrin 5A hydrolase / precorrin-3B C17-methyltransferase